ncbi:hypothetical protein KY333_03000 [Candidatus Woesearchaeota archaeon]|nr:hypothetical protein [Candidatus Woesearchaeota archaeon]MBW2994350.1 hypothetical protein [Candidatus Woesearchaeota archaeon]
MKKIYLLIAASFLLMLVVACAPADRADAEKTTEEVKDTTAVKEPTSEKQTVEEKVVETKPKTTETKEETTETKPAEKTETKTAPTKIPEQVKEIVDKADSKLVSMGYLYGGPENDGRFLDTYYVKGDKIKVKLYEDNIYVTEGYFDTVYLNIVEKTATARCENRKRCISGNTDNMNKVLDANYDDYRRKLPYEWLQDITTPTVIGEEVVDKRSVLKIEYPKKDTMVEMWLDKSYGVPLQIKTIYPNEDEELFQFTNVQFNTLKEEEMVPPPIEVARINQTH